jgi:hypothetical protein
LNLNTEFASGITFTGVVKANSWTGSYNCIFNFGVSGTPSLHFQRYGGTLLRFAAATWDIIDISNTFGLDTDMHLVVTYDSSGFVTIYKNGQNIKEGSVGRLPSVVPWASDPNYYLADSNWGTEPSSETTMRNVKFWEEALSSAQIQSLYESDF